MNGTRIRGIQRVLIAAAAIAVALGVTSSSARLAARGAQQNENGIQPEAMAQIEALLREKETRTPAERKIDSQLLYARRMELGVPIAPGVQTLDVDIPRADDGHVIVDVKAHVTANLMLQLNGLSGEIKRTGGTDLQLHVDLDQIEAIAEQPDVIFVQPQQRAFTSRMGPLPVRGSPASRTARRAAALESVFRGIASQQDKSAGARVPAAAADFPSETNAIGTGTGAVTSQADITHRTAVFRGLTGFNGSGVKVGVLSDGVAHLAAAQASGDLGAVTVLPGQAGNSDDDEGTAMLELIHDIAPGAQLYFATAFTSITSFAQNIRDLRAAGCDIIVDDVGYFVETPFQDGQGPGVLSTTNGGVVTQAVKDVTAAGALYFSAAGNAGNLNDGTSGVWEGDFNPGASTISPPIPAGSGGNFHRFPGGQDFNTLIGGGPPISLYWSDPLGLSGNDYDLFRLNTAGTIVVASSTNLQTGTQDPYEEMSSNTTGPRIVIVKKPGAANRFLHLNTNRGRLSVATAGQIHGHAAANSLFSFAVAAVDAGVSYPSPFSTSNVVEAFSSDGPRKIFYLGDGTPLTPGNVSSTGGASVSKPDFSAADAVAVSGAGGFATPFFGTSAAAPNAAAIMALFKSQNPGLTLTQLRTLLFSTALDIEAPGTDRDSGAGIVMAVAPQAGCTFTLTPPAGNVPILGGSATATVNASSGFCNWVAWSTVPWISMTGGGAGTGTGPLGLTVAVNHGPARTGNIMIQGGQIATVSQLGTPALIFTTSGAVPIPDNTTVEIPLPVSLSLPIVNVTVSVYLTHTFDADLAISLIGPDGTTVPLSTHRGGNGDNYGSACSPVTSRTTFDDSVATSIAVGSAPLVGTFRPEQPLAVFNGKVGATANGTWKLRISDDAGQDTGTFQCFALHFNVGASASVPDDFDGNGRSDLAVFRPGTGQWFVQGVTSPVWGAPFDIPVPSDYNGNGTTDVAVYRPSTGTWFIRNGSPGTIQWGRTGDIPVPADYDGDGRSDTAVYRTTDGTAGVWYLNLTGGGTVVVPWGLRGDVPMPGDYDGDGKADLAVFRPSTGLWFITYAVTGYTTNSATAWGGPGDVPVRADVDHDGRLDFVVFRPSNGTWYLNPTNSAPSVIPFGTAGDIPVVLDTDGDGLTELCVWRPATGTWFIRSHPTVPFGTAGDIPVGARPRVASLAVSDFDGDGVSDLTVFRPSTSTWFTTYSATGFATNASTPWGLAGDLRVNSDYDGDHRADLAVFRPATGEWFIVQSATGTVRITAWGLSGDRPMPADYDGDGRTDLAVYRPSSGEWFVLYSSTNTFASTAWGVSTDEPVAQDFDGDGRADLAVFRPSTGQWFLQLSTNVPPYGPVIVRTWGLSGDVPVAADYDGDGRAEIAVYRPSTGEWFAIDALIGSVVLGRTWGAPGDIARPHDYDGDGRADAAIFRPSTGQWFILRSSNGTALVVLWGFAGDDPRLTAPVGGGLEEPPR